VVVGLVVFLLLAPNRIPKVGTALLGSVGSVLLILAALDRPELRKEPLTAAARHQGDELLAMAIVVCVGVALIQAGMALASRYELVPRVRAIPRRSAAATFLAALMAGTVVAIAAGVPGEVSDRWSEFKDPKFLVSEGDRNEPARLANASGNGRYQLWTAAVDANETARMKGIGPGAFEFWWARNGKIDTGFVRDAHSLYVETLAELGFVGLALLVVFLGTVLVAGVINSLRGPPERRLPRAAATAACAAFLIFVAVDWAWELSVLPVAFVLLGAVAVSRRARKSSSRPRVQPVLRWGSVGLAVLALVAIVIPLAGTTAVRDSHRDVADRQLSPALRAASNAVDVQPGAGTPRLQRALVLELQGDLSGAAGAATAATRKEPTNWRTWFVLSRLEAKRGHGKASVRAYRKAKSLNPRSRLFAP
jgi:hypothetical protein